MANLIETLNKQVGKTPDEIVRALSSKGWIKGADMPQEIWEDWHARRLSVAICHYNHRSQQWSFDGREFSARGWNHRGITRDLANHWFMPSTEWTSDIPYPQGD